MDQVSDHYMGFKKSLIHPEAAPVQKPLPVCLDLKI